MATHLNTYMAKKQDISGHSMQRKGGRNAVKGQLTYALGEAVAPLAVGLTGGLQNAAQDISGVAREAHVVVEVKLGPLGEAKGRVAWVTACDGCQEWKERKLSVCCLEVTVALEKREFILVCVLSFN